MNAGYSGGRGEGSQGGDSDRESEGVKGCGGVTH